MESNIRSLLKTLSYRLAGSFIIVIVVFIFTNRIDLALGAGIAEGIIKMILYYLHERLWNKIKYGQPKGEVIWFTGLSGSGKSAIAKGIAERLKAKGRKVYILDGDAIRDMFPNTGFSRSQRNVHIKRVGYMASLLAKFDVTVLCTLVSPFEASRNDVKRICSNFRLVYIKSSIGACEKRDVKGLYAKARSGEIKQFTGISQAYEPPRHPDFEVFTDKESVLESREKIFSFIIK